MFVKKIIIILFLLPSISYCFAQSKTSAEEKNYKTMEAMFKYFKNKKYDTTQRDFVFKNFVYFDNVLADTAKNRITGRIKFFDMIFPKIFRYADSVGIENLDLISTSFFKDHTSFYKHFDKDGELNEVRPFTLTFYDKRNPKKEPLGALLFEPKTHKLLAWSIINQGGYWYFLTFNLL
ncbi:hypothetical protein H7U22_01810 [Pedobacter sp. CCM 8938]|uniref:Uncharacterized protein n=2 Tax=Pedobacter fastidiosus TaxID=2765361 RepID=A0ABR7KN07_9SPHI|nr:hypothetical protein [Pedobacter fastidiosus]MBC6109147.1 hypothetical protein [Pedobacter fastidiosus]